MSTGKRGNWRDAYLGRGSDRDQSDRDRRGYRDDRRDRSFHDRDYDRPRDDWRDRDRRGASRGEKRRHDDAEEGE